MEHDIGSKLRQPESRKKKLTQEQVAELLGVSRQTISNWKMKILSGYHQCHKNERMP